MKKLTLALVTLLSVPAFSLTFSESPTLNRLAGQADRDPAGYGGREAVHNAAGADFTGEPVRGNNVPVVAAHDAKEDGPQADKPTPKDGKPPTYIFTGSSPIKGVTIFTPRLDPTGNGGNESAKTKEPISKYLVYGALGAGAAATIAGFFFPPLLFLGGLLLGAGAVLGYIRHKLNGSN